jgi:hypothetical protein
LMWIRILLFILIRIRILLFNLIRIPIRLLDTDLDPCRFKEVMYLQYRPKNLRGTKNLRSFSPGCYDMKLKHFKSFFSPKLLYYILFQGISVKNQHSLSSGIL